MPLNRLVKSDFLCHRIYSRIRHPEVLWRARWSWVWLDEGEIARIGLIFSEADEQSVYQINHFQHFWSKLAPGVPQIMVLSGASRSGDSYAKTHGYI